MRSTLTAIRRYRVIDEPTNGFMASLIDSDTTDKSTDEDTRHDLQGSKVHRPTRPLHRGVVPIATLSATPVPSNAVA